MYEPKDKKTIVVFTGPNGAGRRTVAEMVGTTLHMPQVLSYTTREKRPNEAEGEDYYFVDRDTFGAAERQQEFIEVMEIDGNRYGVKGADLAKQLESHSSVYLILNRYGAEILKKLYGDSVKRVFIYADKRTLASRQRERGDSEQLIDRYMSHYDEEMAYKNHCEHVYENLDLAHTIYDVTKALEKYLQRGLLDLD